VGEGSKDGVLEALSADPERLRFRLGVQFRDLVWPAPPQGSLLPARYVRIQVASPPPRRVDGSEWEEGLRLSSGAAFDPRNPPADGRVSPLHGIAPLGQPRPKTIVLDRLLAVPAVPPTQALTRTFTLAPPDPKSQPISFLSVPYPAPSIDGTPLRVAGVTYYAEDELAFDRPVDRPVDGDWIAVSLDRFFPPERDSADYIIRLEVKARQMPVRFPINPAF
jgi:hypothetical protein